MTQGAQQVLKHTKMQRRTITPGIKTHLMIKITNAVIMGVKAQYSLLSGSLRVHFDQDP